MTESETFVLYLNSFAGFPLIDPGAPKTYANVTYNINWDAVFNLNNHIYRKCKIRYEFISDQATSNTYDPASDNAVLILNGINSRSTSRFGGLQLGHLYVQQSTTSASAVTSYLFNSDYTGPGQSIEVPKGFRSLNVQLWTNDYGTSSSTLLSSVSASTLAGWSLMLNFELSDPIKDEYTIN